MNVTWPLSRFECLVARNSRRYRDCFARNHPRRYEIFICITGSSLVRMRYSGLKNRRDRMRVVVNPDDAERRNWALLRRMRRRMSMWMVRMPSRWMNGTCQVYAVQTPSGKRWRFWKRLNELKRMLLNLEYLRRRRRVSSSSSSSSGARGGKRKMDSSNGTGRKNSDSRA